MSASLANGTGALAIVARKRWRGEDFYTARVRVGARTVFRTESVGRPLPCLLDVLEWSTRQGKELDWEYRGL